MGGLVCRCFLQNDGLGVEEARKLVDKVFTYATPHNGIDLRVLGNVPGFFTRNDADNFNRDRMVGYLGLPGGTENVADLDGAFDADRFFCLVGANSKDYSAAAGWSRRVVGPMSDGLVRIANASVHDGARQAPRSFVHRSHSGHYGIVNSEEGYQNLTRFLFGDLRVDGVLEIDRITLPAEVERAWKVKNKTIRASYHFETVVSVRGHDWDLHRRIVSEESAIFRTFDDMFPRQGGRPRYPHLFSVFLSTRERVKKTRRSLGFAVHLAVLVPEYEIDNSLWFNDHFKGSDLFRETIIIQATPQPEDAAVPYKVRYGLNSRTPNKATRNVELVGSDGRYVCSIPIRSAAKKPGIVATLKLTARPWNR